LPPIYYLSKQLWCCLCAMAQDGHRKLVTRFGLNTA